MTAGTWTLTNNGVKDLINGTFDIDGNSWKCGLATSASNIGPSSTTYAALTGEVAATHGYSTGGEAVTLNITGTSPYQVVFSSNPVWTASGGSIVARYAFVYKVSGDILAYVLLDDTPADVTVTDGNQLQVDADGSPQPLFTLSQS